ncbi:MAG: DUF3084 domain-containing protein [Elainellaceae cyanobacterium]
MTSGFVLIAAILILGGVIATAGDRIGMRVGKARLSLFNLRPRQTATLITILTGGVISASTLGLLFAISEQLRTGVFELGEIQDELANANSDLEQTQTNLDRTRRQKARVENELSAAQTQRQAVQDRLRGINRSLQAAIQQEAKTQRQLEDTQTALQQAESNFQQAQQRLQQTQSNFQQAQQRLQQATQQSSELRSEIAQLQQDQEALIARQREREELVANLDQELAQRERQLQALERQQEILERQRAALVQEVQLLDREIQALREGDVALSNGQVLAVGVLEVDSPPEAQQAIDQILRQANQAVLEAILPSVDPLESQVVKIRSAEVAEIIRRISDGQPYIIQISSEGNYLLGEPCVISGQTCIDVSANAVPNELVYASGAPITSVTIDPNEVTDAQLGERLELLVAASQLRARQAGVLTRAVQVSGGGYDDFGAFLADLQDLQQSQAGAFVVRAVAANDIYAIGPLALELIVLQDDRPALDEDGEDAGSEDAGSEDAGSEDGDNEDEVDNDAIAS